MSQNCLDENASRLMCPVVYECWCVRSASRMSVGCQIFVRTARCVPKRHMKILLMFLYPLVNPFDDLYLLPFLALPLYTDLRGCASSEEVLIDVVHTRSRFALCLPT